MAEFSVEYINNNILQTCNLHTNRVVIRKQKRIFVVNG